MKFFTQFQRLITRKTLQLINIAAILPENRRNSFVDLQSQTVRKRHQKEKVRKRQQQITPN